MILGFFMITKVLIAKILMNPEEYSIINPSMITPQVKKNFKLIASVI